MSILIKGVSLKDFKPICPCMNGEYGDCDIPRVKRCYGIGRDGCPLVEIPPHGRLGDLDKLALEMMDAANVDQALAMLDDAPTIIPASDRDINVLGKEEGET